MKKNEFLEPTLINMHNLLHTFILSIFYVFTEFKQKIYGTYQLILLRQFVFIHAEYNNVDSVIHAIDVFKSTRHTLKNTLNKEKLDKIKTLLENKKIDNILELGSLVGYSALYITRFLKEKDIVLTTIEKSIFKTFIANQIIKYAGMKNRVKVKQGKAKKVIPTLNKTYQFVLMDHDKMQYLSDLKLLEKYNLINKGSIIVADNIGIYKDFLSDYLCYVRHSGIYDSVNYQIPSNIYKGIQDAIEVSIKK